MKRKIYSAIGADSVTVEDTLINGGYKDEECCLLYHINVGYPMLDDGARLVVDAQKSEPRTAWSEQNKAAACKFGASVPNQEETCYFLTLKTPSATLVNEKIGKKLTVSYSGDTLPHFVQWKSMASGDYALGLEPCTTLLDAKFAYKIIKPNEKITFTVNISIKNQCND